MSHSIVQRMIGVQDEVEMMQSERSRGHNKSRATHVEGRQKRAIEATEKRKRELASIGGLRGEPPQLYNP